MRYTMKPQPDRLEDPHLLNGGGRFIDDIEREGMAHATFIRSTHAHARVKSVWTDASRALDGVLAVFTLDDLAPVLRRQTIFDRERLPTVESHSVNPVLASGETCYVGEPIAIVVAKDRYRAEDAADLVRVEYEALACVPTLEKAIAQPNTPAHTKDGSTLLQRYTVEYGEQPSDCGPGVYREKFKIHRGLGIPLEGRGVVAAYDPSARIMEIAATTQRPHEFVRTAQDVVDLSGLTLRHHQPDLGGGFGTKLVAYPEYFACIAASRLLERSIRWSEDRSEHFLSSVQERDQLWDMQIHYTKDGLITAIDGRLAHDIGAYVCHDLTLPFTSAVAVCGPYAIPAFRLEVEIYKTNRTPVSSIRGAGYPQACFVMERLLDRVAARTGLDRSEVRARNLISADKMPYKKPLRTRGGADIIYDSGDFRACQQRVVALSGWNAFQTKKAIMRDAGRFVGLGLANAIKGTGRGPYETALVRVSEQGDVAVLTGAVSMGQGLASALAQIAGEAFDLPASVIDVVCGDTSSVRSGFGGFASRQLVTAGSSVYEAARAVRHKAMKLAAHVLLAKEADIEVKGGAFALREEVAAATGRNKTSCDLRELARLAASPNLPPELSPVLEASASVRLDLQTYSYTSHVAEVEIDAVTGNVKVTKYYVVQDAGRLINRTVVIGQIHGAVAHGLGNALYERMMYDENGQPLTVTLADYRIPTALTSPEFVVDLTETHSPINPLGSKGVGELATLPVAAAIASAIEDALHGSGLMLSQAPFTHTDILRGCLTISNALNGSAT